MILKVALLVLIYLMSGFPNDVQLKVNTTIDNGTLDQLNQRQKAFMGIYYKWLHCMVVRQMAYSATKYETKAIAFLLSEGQSITLDSWLCLLPDQNDKLIVRWKFLAIDGIELSFIEQDGDKYFVHQDSQSLEVTNVKKKDTGFYFANVNYEHDSAAYFVEVSQSEVFEDVSKYTTDSMYEPPEHVLHTRNLRIHVRMNEWTHCSRCGLIGVRQRLGVCFVEQYDYDKPIKPVHHPTMDMFLGGLPCRSAFLPKEFKEMPDIQNTQSVYVKGFCKIPCSKESESTTDEFGNPIENRTKSIGRLLSQTATNFMQRILKTRTVVQAKNKGTILVCPERNRLGQPIVWRKDEELIFSDDTMSRLSIDHTGRIRIRKLQMQDSGSYSCWIGDELAGTVKLVVKDRFVPPAHLIAMLPILSYVLVLIVLIFLGCKMWCNRNN